MSCSYGEAPVVVDVDLTVAAGLLVLGTANGAVCGCVGMLTVPTDSMYGGVTRHYFEVE